MGKLDHALAFYHLGNTPHLMVVTSTQIVCKAILFPCGTKLSSCRFDHIVLLSVNGATFCS